MGETVVEIDDGLFHGCPSLVLATHLNTPPRSRIPCVPLAGEGSMIRGRGGDQGARSPLLAPHLPRLVSLQVTIKPDAGAKHGRAPAFARDQAPDGGTPNGGMGNPAPGAIATTH